MHPSIKIKKQYHCLICFNDLLHDFSFQSINGKYLPICQTCQNQFERANLHFQIQHYPIWILYYYNDFIKKLIYQYKGCYDIALAPVFLADFIEQLKKKYKDYVILFPPSTDQDNQKRGFLHMEEIAKQIHQNVWNIFYKTENYKQSNIPFDNRSLIHKVIGIKNFKVLENQKILLMDDIYTSGNTIQTCLNLITKNVVKIKDLQILCICQAKKKTVEI